MSAEQQVAKHVGTVRLLPDEKQEAQLSKIIWQGRYVYNRTLYYLVKNYSIHAPHDFQSIRAAAYKQVIMDRRRRKKQKIDNGKAVFYPGIPSAQINEACNDFYEYLNGKPYAYRNKLENNVCTLWPDYLQFPHPDTVFIRHVGNVHCGTAADIVGFLSKAVIRRNQKSWFLDLYWLVPQTMMSAHGQMHTILHALVQDNLFYCKNLPVNDVLQTFQEMANGLVLDKPE